MIALIHFSGSAVAVQELCQEKEQTGWEVIGVSCTAHGGIRERRDYLIALRGENQPAPLGSRLQKGLRLALTLADSEATGPVVTALAALAEGRESVHDMDVIESTLARLGK